ncbi:SIS domain-containing protein [Acetobacteraceae bacterium]|nr:SIS domain-containing protein [Acetobacteraceae bacterium]
MPDTILNAFERSLYLEKEAIQKLCLLCSKDQLFRQSILDLVIHLNNIPNHIVFSGVGKSGYVARLIQSGFSSVGIPSFFLHPTEAAHGELGTLKKDNFLLLLSKSGNTAELQTMIEYAKSRSIRTGIITTTKKSPLAQMSDIVIEMPISTESGLFGMSPTTSSLLFLALGNALATSIAELKKVKKENFLESHPAGAIGKISL